MNWARAIPFYFLQNTGLKEDESKDYIWIITNTGHKASCGKIVSWFSQVTTTYTFTCIQRRINKSFLGVQIKQDCMEGIQQYSSFSLDAVEGMPVGLESCVGTVRLKCRTIDIF